MPSPLLPQDIKSLKKLRCYRPIKSLTLVSWEGRSAPFIRLEKRSLLRGTDKCLKDRGSCRRGKIMKTLLTRHTASSISPAFGILGCWWRKKAYSHLFGRKREALTPHPVTPPPASLTGSSPAAIPRRLIWQDGGCDLDSHMCVAGEMELKWGCSPWTAPENWPEFIFSVW